MAEFDLGYFDPAVKRTVGPRKFRHRLIAWELGRALYDGTRETGYGGFRYDGRWKNLIPRLVARYGLSARSSVLEIGCKKGFFLHDLKETLPGITVRGIENHSYPIEHGMDSVRPYMMLGDYARLPYGNREFDFVMAFTAIYMLDLGGVMRALREIQRVGKGKSYITCGAYRSEAERALFARWSLLGTTVLHVDEWLELFDYVGYTGDWYFTTATTLNLSPG